MAPRITAGLIKKLVEDFDRVYFGGSLPPMEIKVMPVGQAGDAISPHDWAAVGKEVRGPWVLEIRMLDAFVHPSYLRANVLHELAHIHLFSQGKMHTHRSKAWKEEIHRLSALGALRETI
jgi:hypothetical protein